MIFHYMYTQKLCWITNAKKFSKYYYSKTAVMTTEEGIKQIKNNLDKINDWVDIYDLIPKFYLKNQMKTGI